MNIKSRASNLEEIKRATELSGQFLYRPESNAVLPAGHDCQQKKSKSQPPDVAPDLPKPRIRIGVQTCEVNDFDNHKHENDLRGPHFYLGTQLRLVCRQDKAVGQMSN